MAKMFILFYEAECQFIRYMNQYFEQKYVNLFFRTVTHLGGAKFTIGIILLLSLFTNQSVQITAVSSACALAISHIPVAISKKLLPRRRPYLVLDQINVTQNPLQDHSFPSGHTTAIFSIVIPFILYEPILALLLLPISFLVGLSRIYLGLHYPSDVLAGVLLGSFIGVGSFVFWDSLFNILV
ncbi:phosphatase PAP2 family protein [Oceanobacillus salinisoli]|uniref:phosphatase PAP2 family protein n=1 Tax=Oceanobacillus salinisoli TaxID=2678611 RepID=UPI0012E2378F|nr:phosphatase PAP2 family protein [Oceanobacillus salinisoli]